MQTNPNIEDKRIIEVWDWKDFRGDYQPWQKKYYRKLRRKRQNEAIREAVLSDNGISDN